MKWLSKVKVIVDNYSDLILGQKSFFLTGYPAWRRALHQKKASYIHSLGIGWVDRLLPTIACSGKCGADVFFCIGNKIPM